METCLLLVHSPLVTASTWELVAGSLAEDGHAVILPDLVGTLTAGPPYHRRQARVIADSAAGRPVVLVGHSGAGPLLATAGMMLGEGARGYVFVDAGLPTPGRSWMQTVPPDLAAQLRAMTASEGWLPPWSRWWGDEELAALLPDPVLRERFASECPRLPLALFEETHPPAPGWPNAPGGYLQLSEAYEAEAAAARELGWPVIQHRSHHLALLTEPDVVAGEILRLIGRLEPPTPGSSGTTTSAASSTRSQQPACAPSSCTSTTSPTPHATAHTILVTSRSTHHTRNFSSNTLTDKMCYTA